MVGPCEIIAERLRTIFPEEYGTGILNLPEIGERLIHAKLQMLRGDFVCDRNAGGERGHEDDLSVGFDGSPGDLCAGQLRKLAFKLRLYGFCKPFARRYKHGGSICVVLRLRKQIRRHEAGVAGAIRKNENFGRPCDHIDIHKPEHLPLGFRNIDVAGADDFIHPGNVLCAVCKRGDGLKASRYQRPCRIFSACGGAALYRKSILDKIGVFDELFFAYYEDVDLSWRANNFGYKNVYCPTAKCRHICGATTGAVRYNPFKSIQSGRNSILLPYKNQPVVMLVVNFIPMLLGYLLKVIMFRHRGFGNDYAKGYAEAKIALPKIKKPKFYWRNLPNYLWCEGSMIVGLFRYLVYRVQRALKIT